MMRWGFQVHLFLNFCPSVNGMSLPTFEMFQYTCDFNSKKTGYFKLFNILNKFITFFISEFSHSFQFPIQQLNKISYLEKQMDSLILQKLIIYY